MSRTAALPAASAWAVGTWYAAGALTTVAGGGERLGVLPPYWTLAALAAIAWLLVVMARVPLDASRPLYLPLVSLLPWLPVPLPAALLIWVGPIGIALAAGAGAATAWLTWRERRRSSGAASSPASAMRATTALAFVAGLAATFSLTAWRMAPVLPDGDEPHYLVITQSLLNDGDLRIEDNHRRREYLAYIHREIPPDTRRRGQDDEIYSIHAPGLPVLVLPAFAVAGYPGAVVWLSLLSALGALVVCNAAGRVGGSRDAARFATASVVLSVPCFFQAFTIFPDGTAAVIVIAVVTLATLRERPLDVRSAATAGVLLALLPWLHTRYALLSAALGLVVIGRMLWPGVRSGTERQAPESWRTRLPHVATFAVPAVIGAFLWLYYFKAIYGVWDPRAPYGFVSQVRLARVPQGLAGLFFDQQFGLLPNAPIYLVAPFGVVALWRRSRRMVVELAMVVVPYVLAVAGFTMWWGGHSSPVRFLVPVLPVMALPLAAWWSSPRSRAARTGAVLLLGVSLALTGVLAVVERGALVYNWRDGHALWALAASRAVNLTLALPSFFQGSVADVIQLAAILALVVAAGFALLVLLERLRLRPGAWALAAGLCAVAVTSSGAAAGWATTGHDPRDPAAGAVWVAGRACGAGLRGYWTRSLRVQDARDAVGALTITDASRRSRSEDSPLWTAHDLPPGRYRLTATVAAHGDVALRVTVRQRSGAPIAQCRVGGNATADGCEFDLPAGAVQLFVDADPAARARVDAVTLRAVELGPAADCDLRATGASATESGALYLVDGRGYVDPSGIWTAPGHRVTVVPSGSKRPSTRLHLQIGAPTGRVVVSSGAWREEKRLTAGEIWEVDVPGRPYADAAQRIEVWTDASFRKSDLNPQTRDLRVLGVRVTR